MANRRRHVDDPALLTRVTITATVCASTWLEVLTMIAAEVGVCERLEVLERTVATGSEREISAALREIDALAAVAWRRAPVTFADIKERALIVRANMDKDSSGAPVTDCPLTLATAHLVDAILRLADG